ncbi:hypothetical protein ACRRTK_015958 [Alexandromys fortis]
MLRLSCSEEIPWNSTRNGLEVWLEWSYKGFLNHMNNASHSVLQPSFQGCMQLIQIDDQLVDLNEVAQRKPGSFANVTIDMCAIIDRDADRVTHSLDEPMESLRLSF